ncbi:MAG: peptidylprolyl isomerase [Actinomycetota bacterium]
MGRRRFFLVTIVVVGLSLTGCRALFETAAAVVNGRKIEQDLVQRQLRFILTDPRLAEQLPGPAAKRPELTRQFLTFLIHQELLVEYARTRRIAVRSQEIDERLQSEFIGVEGQEVFAARLEQTGATVADARHLIGQQILRQRVVEAVAEEELSDERLLQEYRSRLPELTTVEVSHILVNDGDQATSLAGRATPENFAALARRFSKDPSSAPQGGDLGSQPASDLVSAVARVVVTAEVGAIVGPVESEFGFHVIWIRTRETPPFETIRPQLVAELQTPVFAEWLLDRVREAEIRVNPSYGVFDPASGEVVARRAARSGPDPVQLTP